MTKHSPRLLTELSSFDKKGRLTVVSETPKGSRNKYAYDADEGYFCQRFVLPEGMVFPFDFGFIPSTKGEDGDPLDVLILMEAPTVPGCVLKARLIGAIKAMQKDKGKKPVRNDRLIVAAENARLYDEVKELSDLPTSVTEQIEDFFVDYNKERGKVFKPLGRCNAREALRLVKKGQR